MDAPAEVLSARGVEKLFDLPAGVYAPGAGIRFGTDGKEAAG